METLENKDIKTEKTMKLLRRKEGNADVNNKTV